MWLTWQKKPRRPSAPALYSAAQPPFITILASSRTPACLPKNITGPSPHDNMEPQVSAERIIEHVSYGLELARKHRLPKAFREIIAEHHGSSVLRFFYSKACAQLPEGQDPETIRPF